MEQTTFDGKMVIMPGFAPAYESMGNGKYNSQSCLSTQRLPLTGLQMVSCQLPMHWRKYRYEIILTFGIILFLDLILYVSEKLCIVQWLAHWPLVLKVPGSIPAVGEDKLGVRKRFSSCHLQG